MKEYTTIVPRIPPAVDGVGDYALALARFLREHAGFATRFVVGDPTWSGAKAIEGFEIDCLSVRTAAELDRLLASESTSFVILHYAGYGYAKRGCPLWLVKGLERWISAHRTRRIVTMFHEVYAQGPPWTSAFWLSTVQRNLVARLASMSEQSLTSLEIYARMVEQLGSAMPVRVTHRPVFSSIGEPHSIPRLDARSKKMVVFGTSGRRGEVYKKSGEELTRICRSLGINEIVDIGRPVGFDISSKTQIPIVERGELTSTEISKILLDAVAGVVDYPCSLLGKSTIFAAYCSHGIAPFVASAPQSLSADGLKENDHYWSTTAPTDGITLNTAQKTADRALVWYQTHSLAAHALGLVQALQGHTCKGTGSAGVFN